MRKILGYPIVLIAGATLLLVSTSSFSQTQSKTQNVAVVNTPTVTIGSTVGVDVLSLPNQVLAVAATEAPTYWRDRIIVSAGDPARSFGFTTDPPAGMRFVVKSIFISGTQNDATYVDKVMLRFPGGFMYLPVSKYPDQIVSMPDTTIAIPPGDLDIMINYVGANFAESNWINLLMTWYLVPRE